MKRKILEILRCPLCAEKLTLQAENENQTEVRSGRLICDGKPQHSFKVQDGIIRFCTHFDHEAVQKELAYENSTYHGSERLTDPKLIAHFPETLADLWPHTLHFGPDFEVLIQQIQLHPGDWVLDIGTGPCWSSRLLAQRGARVIALDVNDANFYGLKTSDILFATHKIYFERILESMTCLPFADGSLDKITFNASFHHTPDHEQTLRECFRVLKPDGVVAMVNEEFASMRQRVFSNGEVTDGGSHHSIAYGDFERALKRTGFHRKFFVAAHVRNKLRQKFSERLGNVLADGMERVPIVLKQLNSALILLSKQPDKKPFVDSNAFQQTERQARSSVASSAV